MTDLEPEFGFVPVKPGSVLRGKYHVTDQLAAGTRGFIFAAEMQKDKATTGPRQKVILKVSDGEWEFRNELWLTRKKFHEIVGSPFVYEVFPLTKQPWCVCAMERFGPNLCTAWKGYSNNESKCRECFRSLLERLQPAHALHLAHLDIKPLNICEAPDMQSWRLVDWGLAENMALLPEQDTDPRGALCYRSPEMLIGQGWDCATDIWSAGVVLLEVYLGQVWDDDHWQLFDWPEHCGEEVLEQMERHLGRLPDWMRGDRAELEESAYGKPDTLFSRFPENLADLLRHLLNYDPAHRATARDALLHIWFAVPDPTSANVIAWLEQTFQKWHATWEVSDVERTSVDQALGILCANGDSEVADGWVQALVNSEFMVAAKTFGKLIEAHLKHGLAKNAKRWLHYTCTRQMDMGEDAVLRILHAAGRDYEQVVKCLEDAHLPIGPAIFTFMGQVAHEPYRLNDMERILAKMLNCGVVPECAFITMLFNEYPLEYAANNGNNEKRRKHSVASYLKGTDHHQKGHKQINSNVATRAATAIRRVIFLEPMPKLDQAAVTAMYNALGFRSQELLSRDPELRERLSQINNDILQEAHEQNERRRLKAEATQARMEELARRKEEATIMAQLRAQQLSRASKSVPRNRHAGCQSSRGHTRSSMRRTKSLTSLRQSTKVSPWR